MEDKKEKDKNDRIKDEIKKLNRLFVKVDNKTKKAVHSLIENAAFMAVTLEDLQIVINEKGCVSEYQNGENQWGTKKSPEVEVYNSMFKNHMSVIKQLTDLLPKQEVTDNDDGFDNFVSDRDD